MQAAQVSARRALCLEFLQGIGVGLLNQNVRMAYQEDDVMHLALLGLLGLEITVEWHAGIR